MQRHRLKKPEVPLHRVLGPTHGLHRRRPRRVREQRRGVHQNGFGRKRQGDPKAQLIQPRQGTAAALTF